MKLSLWFEGGGGGVIVAGNQPSRYWSVFFWCDFDGDAGRWMWWWLWCDKWYLLLWTKRLLMVVIFVTKWKNCKKKRHSLKMIFLPGAQRRAVAMVVVAASGTGWVSISEQNWKKKSVTSVQFYAFINNLQWAFFCRMATLAWLYLSLGHQFEIDKIKLTHIAHLNDAIVLKTINIALILLCVFPNLGCVSPFKIQSSVLAGSI